MISLNSISELTEKFINARIVGLPFLQSNHLFLNVIIIVILFVIKGLIFNLIAPGESFLWVLICFQIDFD